jgi:hypothetical protein
MAAKKQEPMKLTVGERSGIIEQTRAYESVLRDEKDLLQDSGSVQQKVAKNRAILEKDDALVARGKQKDRAVAEIKILLEKVNRMRPTRRMMESKPGTPEFEQAVRINMEFHRVCTPMMLRIKSLQMCLEPDDPMSGDLERIRPT